MDDLFEILIFVVIGIISLVFRGLKRQGKSDSPREGEAKRSPWGDIFRDILDEPIHMPKPVEVYDENGRRIKVPQTPVNPGPIGGKKSYEEVHQEGVAGVVSQPPSPSPIEIAPALGFENLSLSDAARGIIWAEILGKPKALRK